MGTFNLAPLPDAANATTMMITINAAMFFMHPRAARIDRVVALALALNVARCPCVVSRTEKRGYPVSHHFKLAMMASKLLVNASQ